MKIQQLITDYGQGNIFVSIDNKQVKIRRTVHQVERFNEFLKKNESTEIGSEKMNAADAIKRSYQMNLELAEIALNPTPNETPFPRELIEEKMDMDQVEFIAGVFVGKLTHPRIDRDPRLALPEKS